MTYFFVLYCSLWLNLFDCKSHSRKHIHINMTCICVHVWINSKQQSQSHHTGLYVTCLQSVQCLAAVLPVKRATGGSLACGLHFSWMNINTIHAITMLVIFRGLLPQPDSHRSNLMKTLNLLVRLIVYMGKLNALGRCGGMTRRRLQRGNESKPGPTSGKFDSV